MTHIGPNAFQALIVGLEHTFLILYILRKRFGNRLLEDGVPYEKSLAMNPHDQVLELLSRGKGNDVWRSLKKVQADSFD